MNIFNMFIIGPIFLNQFILLSHEPWYGCEYCINIHGHLHNAKLDNDHYFNANLAQHNYMPIDIKNEIYINLNNIKRNNEPFLKEWYADQYYFFNDRDDIPVKNHKLIQGYENIDDYIAEYNKENKTKFSRRCISWSDYKPPMKDFIYRKLNERKETLRKEE